MPSNKNPWEVLGVSPSANQDEIKKAYRNLVKKYHPDRYQDPKMKAFAEERMQEINAAYSVLTKKNSGSYGYSHDSAYGYTGEPFRGKTYTSYEEFFSDPFVQTIFQDFFRKAKQQQGFNNDNVSGESPFDSNYKNSKEYYEPEMPYGASDYYQKYGSTSRRRQRSSSYYTRRRSDVMDGLSTCLSCGSIYCCSRLLCCC